MARRHGRSPRIQRVLDHYRFAPGVLTVREKRLVATVVMQIEAALGIPEEPAHRQMLADLGGPVTRLW